MVCQNHGTVYLPEATRTGHNARIPAHRTVTSSRHEQPGRRAAEPIAAARHYVSLTERASSGEVHWNDQDAHQHRQ